MVKASSSKHDQAPATVCPETLHLIQNYTNFNKSSKPARILNYNNGDWLDFTQESLSHLIAAFSAKHPAVKLNINDVPHVVDFLRMLQTDLTTGASRSVAWIDDKGSCFFPKSFAFDGAGCESSPVIGRQNGGENNKNKRILASESINPAAGIGRLDYNKPAEESSRPSKIRGTATGQRFPSRPPAPPAIPATPPRYILPPREESHVGSEGVKLIPMPEGSIVFEEIKSMLLLGMSAYPDLKVTAIRQCTTVNPSGRLRWQTFLRNTELMLNLRGDANVRYAWVGGPLPILERYALEGFSLNANVPSWERPYGNGFHLSAQEHAYLSIARRDPDANDSYHVLLCQVLLGKMEAIPYGSSQRRPTNDALFDSGGDDAADPKLYIVWETCINTRILPEYLITFKLPDKIRDQQTVERKRLAYPHVFVEINASSSLQDPVVVKRI